jgi:hypothetical protein
LESTDIALACSNNALGQKGGTALAATMQILTELVEIDIRYSLRMWRCGKAEWVGYFYE